MNNRACLCPPVYTFDAGDAFALCPACRGVRAAFLPGRPLNGTTLQLHHDRAPRDFVVDATQPDRFKEAVVVVDHPFAVNSELVRASLAGGTITMPEPTPSVCARRNPSCNGWQRWRFVDGNVYHARPVPLQVCKSERARWGRCCEKAAQGFAAWAHDPPTVGEVWALAEKRERQRDQAIEESEAWQREANAARVGAAEAAADLARLQDAVRAVLRSGVPVLVGCCCCGTLATCVVEGECLCDRCNGVQAGADIAQSDAVRALRALLPPEATR